MSTTVETSVIAFPKPYQSSGEEKNSLLDVEHGAALSAEELKSRWLKHSIPPWDVSERTKIIHTAYVSGMSDAAFCALFGQLYFGGSDGGDIVASNQTIAALCDKSLASVKRANMELEKGGWISSTRRRNKPSLRSARIPEDVLAKIVGELSGIVEQSRKLKYEPSQTQESSNMSLLEPECTKNGQNTPPESSNMILLKSRKLIFEPLPLEEEDYNHITRAREPEVAKTEACTISENQFQTFNRVYSEWGMRPGALEIQPWLKTPRSITDPNLTGYVAAHGDKPVAIVSQALFEALTYMADKRADELQREGGGGRGKAGFGSYFAKTLRAKVTELMLAEKEAAAKAALIDEKARLAKDTEAAIAGMKTKAFADRVEIGHKAAAARAPAPRAPAAPASAVVSARFDDSAPKVAVVKEIWITGEDANKVIDRVPGVDAKQVKEVLAEADNKPDNTFYARGGFGGNNSRKISVSAIIDWCVTRIEAKIMAISLGVMA